MLKTQFHCFFKIPLVKFDLQRHDVPQIKSLDISLWSVVIILVPELIFFEQFLLPMNEWSKICRWIAENNSCLQETWILIMKFFTSLQNSEEDLHLGYTNFSLLIFPINFEYSCVSKTINTKNVFFSHSLSN